MPSKRTYIAVSVVLVPPLVAALVTTLHLVALASSGVFHGDGVIPLRIKARILDETHREPLANAQVFYTLIRPAGDFFEVTEVHRNVDLLADDFPSVGIIDILHYQGYSETGTEEERSKLPDNLIFTITITKEGYISRQFDVDTEDFPRDENYRTVVDLGDVLMTREQHLESEKSNI